MSKFFDMIVEFFVFIFGLIFGSFANVVVLRLNTGESLVFKGSRCFFCSRKLSWFENIPLISFLVLQGRCRTCKSRISWQYPAVEFSSGLLFLLLYLKILPNFQVLNFVIIALFFWLLLVISVYDLHHKIIPNSLVYLASGVSLLFVIVDSGYWNLIPHLLSGFGLFAFFALLWLISKGRWMGFGDAKLALAIGIMLGWPLSLTALVFSFWLGAFVGIAFLLGHRVSKLIWTPSVQVGLKTQIPFGPFLFTGSLIVFLWGEQLIARYFSLL